MAGVVLVVHSIPVIFDVCSFVCCCILLFKVKEERSHRSLGQVPPLGSASTCVIRGGAAVWSHNVQVFRSVGGKENEAKQRVACALPSTKYRAGGC